VNRSLGQSTAQRFQRGCQCYLFFIVVCGACQLPKSQADDLLCGAKFYFSAVQGEFQPLPVGSGSATADISELYRSRVFPSLTNPVGGQQPLRDSSPSALRDEEFGLVFSALGAAFRLVHKVPWPGKGLAEDCVLTLRDCTQMDCPSRKCYPARMPLKSATFKKPKLRAH